MNRPKKILLVSNTAWSIFNFRLPLAKFIQWNGHSVTATAPFDEYAKKLAQVGVPFESITMDNKGSNPFKDLLLLFRLIAKYYRLNPDLIIHYTIKPNIYGSVAARLLGKKSIAVVTGLGTTFIQHNFTTALVIRMYKIAFLCSSKIIFLNETDRTLFCRLKIVKRNKTVVHFGEGVDTKFYKPQPKSSQETATTFLYVGRLIYDKGIRELIEATRNLKKEKPNVKLQFVGFLDALNLTAVKKEELDAWIDEGLVEFLGAHSDVRTFISNADCVVLPSYREGISRTLLESASMAKPIIATDVTGCREVVVHNESGFLCKVKSAESLYEAMLQFTNLNEETRQKMGLQGRELILSTFSNEQGLSAYSSLFDELLHKKFDLECIQTNIKVSVITVIYDNHTFIREAIESVLHQTYNNVQYIVIDGGSNDGSLEIIKSFGDKISIVVSEPDEGIYDAMNKGLSLATGDIIGFLNADDFYAHTEVLQQVAQTFIQTNCDALYADLDYISRNNKNKIVRKWRSGVFDKSRFIKGWMPPHPTFFVRKEIYKRLGGFNKQLHLAADYELMLRFCYFNDIKVSYLPEVIVKMRLGGQSNRSFGNRIKANIQDKNAWTMNGVKPKWYTLLLKPLSKITQYF